MSQLLLSAPQLAVFTGWTSSGQSFEVVDRVTAIDPEVWRALFPPHWKDYSYYQTLEEIFFDQFPQRYLLLKAADDPDRIVAIQPCFLVTQDPTVSLPRAVRAVLRPLRRWLKLRLLMVGCVVGEAQTGANEAMQERSLYAELEDGLAQYARYERIATILFKDMPARFRGVMAPLVAGRGYTRLPSLPAVRLPLDFATFEDYVQNRLGKATRKNLRRKFKEVERGETPLTLEVKTAITPEEACTLHALYERIALSGDVAFEVFTPEYFRRLGERMPEQTRYFIWRQGRRIVAFSFCLVHGDAIYDNDIGLDAEAASRLHLYYVTFRDIIQWALAHGITEYYSSPFNYDPKLHLKMQLVPLDLYARHRNSICNFFLGRFAFLAAPTRQEPVLEQFANAGEL